MVDADKETVREELSKDVPESEDQVEISMSPEEEIETLREQLKVESERRLRAMADAENLKRRLTREKEEFVKYAAETVLRDILPALDNLDLALTHGRGNEACKDFVMGVEMTRKALMDALKGHGVAEFGEIGEAFDPAFHEALGLMARPDLDQDCVAEVVQKGFRLHDRLLRAAKVMVNKTS
ncbi:nucleotide exchange factor GrpE [Desulfovibrio inopinatus]|uniref:nucleotide exchange factor GrpE n=1 Tax=Desulfovibrio inopinatus TaxID=102109 RepID=UPI0004001BBC|nr:nucleotide exchange factor GrpE [Desulfovibrio inopinatus]